VGPEARITGHCNLLAISCRSDPSSRRTSYSLLLIALLSIVLDACKEAQAPPPLRTGAFSAVFAGRNLTPRRLSLQIAYGPNLSNERYFMYVPSSYTGAEPYGLIVFTYAGSAARLPLGWQAVLEARKYIFLSAENAGNDLPRPRRLGLAVIGALRVMRAYNVDPSRVYAAGFSGGARVAGLLGFYQSDVFRGTLQNCGADFYRTVPVVDATSQIDTAGNAYGLLEASAEEVRQAKNVRFALITGTGDFRRGNILDIFHGGFEQDGFQAKLFDVRGMGHDICDGQTLARALDYLEKGS
jgi:hypothetical protein